MKQATYILYIHCLLAHLFTLLLHAINIRTYYNNMYAIEKGRWTTRRRSEPHLIVSTRRTGFNCHAAGLYSIFFFFFYEYLEHSIMKYAIYRKQLVIKFLSNWIFLTTEKKKKKNICETMLYFGRRPILFYKKKCGLVGPIALSHNSQVSNILINWSITITGYEIPKRKRIPARF